MKKPKLEDYELFYMEIPREDYLNRLTAVALSGSDEPETYNKLPTMSVAQVSAIARDQLGSLKPFLPEVAAREEEQDTLFTTHKSKAKK